MVEAGPKAQSSLVGVVTVTKIIMGWVEASIPCALQSPTIFYSEPRAAESWYGESKTPEVFTNSRVCGGAEGMRSQLGQQLQTLRTENQQWLTHTEKVYPLFFQLWTSLIFTNISE